MTQINVLCNGLQRYKPRAFVFPLHRYNAKLEERDINCNIYHSSLPTDVADCDVLLVQDEVVRRNNNISITLDELYTLRENVDTLVYYDTDDSTGNIRSDELAFVDYYFKSQLLTDRHRYLEPMYGSCLYTDYYHDQFDIDDGDERYSVPIEAETALDKLRVGWNIGVVPKIFLPFYSEKWKIVESIPNAFYHKLPWDSILGLSPIWKPPATARSVAVSGRFSTSYPRATVEFHRNRMADVLEGRFDPKKVSRRAYWHELRNARVLLSPFGLGEVCHRDFEGFLSGNIVLKPSMEHLETWPPLFESGETYVEVSWDMTNAEETLDTVLDNYDRYLDIAETAQERYREYLVGETAAERFVDHFENLLQSMSVSS